LFPFSFSEYLILKQVDPILSFEIEQRALFRKLLYSYLEEGGFPEPILQFKEISTRVLQEYLNTIFYKDVMERKNLSSPIAAKHVLGEFCNQAGSLFTVNKTFRRLNSLGYKVQKSFVSEILEGLHDAYAFFPVSIYSKSIAKRNTNPKKLYGIDTGLLNSVSGFEDRKTGHLLENLIYLHLRRKTEDLYYYKTLSGFEVDFVFTERASNSNRLLFIQVCETLTHPETLSRELRALEEALAENSGSQGLLLTMDSKPPVVKLDPKIQILEVIDFLIRKS
jgi:predicted AAA+ superfamily ATPase